MDYDKVNNIVNKEDWKGILQDYDYLKLDESKILQKLISHDILKGKRYKIYHTVNRLRSLLSSCHMGHL